MNCSGQLSQWMVVAIRGWGGFLLSFMFGGLSTVSNNSVQGFHNLLMSKMLPVIRNETTYPGMITLWSYTASSVVQIKFGWMSRVRRQSFPLQHHHDVLHLMKLLRDLPFLQMTGVDHCHLPCYGPLCNLLKNTKGSLKLFPPTKNSLGVFHPQPSLGTRVSLMGQQTE